MNVEQRLMHAFGQVDRLEPSDDLWGRVVHSIEEDRLHRRRVIRTAAGVVGVAAVLVAVGAASVVGGGAGRHVRWEVMETLELVLLLVLVLTLGPAIRRFGRGYASDLFADGRRTGEALIRLLDLAYSLVFAGYIVISVELVSPMEELRLSLGEQLGDAAIRVGGLLLLMGILHALTIAALPIVALIANSTRTGRPVPKWVWLIVLIGIWQASGLLLLPLIGLS